MACGVQGSRVQLLRVQGVNFMRRSRVQSLLTIYYLLIPTFFISLFSVFNFPFSHFLFSIFFQPNKPIKIGSIFAPYLKTIRG